MINAACCCSSPDCRAFGCRQYRQPPLCQNYTVQSPWITPLPQGCICPPTSERTCQNGVCPRKSGVTSSLPSQTTQGTDP